MVKHYTDRSNCARAAKQALKADGVEAPKAGVHFEVVAGGTIRKPTYTWMDVRESTTEKLARENDPEVLPVEPEADEEPAPLVPLELMPPAPEPPPKAMSAVILAEPIPIEPAGEAEEAPEGAEAGDDSAPLLAVLLPASYGLTPEVEAAILALGKALGAKRNPPKVERPTITGAAIAAAAQGKLPPRLEFKSQANYSYQRHADALFKLAEAGNRLGLEAYAIKGTNTYARALKRYRDAAVAFLQQHAAQLPQAVAA